MMHNGSRRFLDILALLKVIHLIEICDSYIAAVAIRMPRCVSMSPIQNFQLSSFFVKTLNYDYDFLNHNILRWVLS